MKNFAEKQQVNYPLISSAETEMPAPFNQIASIPTTFFIDRQGIIQEVLVGYHDLEQLKSHALKEDYSPPPERENDDSSR